MLGFDTFSESPFSSLSGGNPVVSNFLCRLENRSTIFIDRLERFEQLATHQNYESGGAAFQGFGFQSNAFQGQVGANGFEIVAAQRHNALARMSWKATQTIDRIAPTESGESVVFRRLTPVESLVQVRNDRISPLELRYTASWDIALARMDYQASLFSDHLPSLEWLATHQNYEPGGMAFQNNAFQMNAFQMQNGVNALEFKASQPIDTPIRLELQLQAAAHAPARFESIGKVEIVTDTLAQIEFLATLSIDRLARMEASIATLQQHSLNADDILAGVRNDAQLPAEHLPQLAGGHLLLPAETIGISLRRHSLPEESLSAQRGDITVRLEVTAGALASANFLAALEIIATSQADALPRQETIAGMRRDQWALSEWNTTISRISADSFLPLEWTAAAVAHGILPEEALHAVAADKLIWSEFSSIFQPTPNRIGNVPFRRYQFRVGDNFILKIPGA